MKFFVAAVSAAAVASAAAVKRDTIFTVSDFTAACITHSTQCSYNFGVLQPGTMETTPVTCKALVTANNDGTLPDVTDGTCENSSRTWTVVRGSDGLTLTVSQPVSPSSNSVGSHLLATSDLATSDGVQSYTGATSFDLN